MKLPLEVRYDLESILFRQLKSDQKQQDLEPSDDTLLFHSLFLDMDHEQPLVSIDLKMAILGYTILLTILAPSMQR